MSPSFLLVAPLVLPLLGACLLALTGSRPNLLEAVTLITSVLLACAVWTLLQEVLAGGRPAITLTEVAPGLPLALEIEPLGMLFACVASGLWIVNSLYSIGSMRGNGSQPQPRFFVCISEDRRFGQDCVLSFYSRLFP